MSYIPHIKKLPSYTVIPPALYVERNADRQLIANLDQMERPAYILVARQMGKTNLLLHTKQTVENSVDKVVYVDLSASFSDERECFRRIVDYAIESCADVFGHLENKILEIRATNRPPAREHDTEMRMLLRATQGKLVIILDEIDSLTNASFSDRVFAHIRSVYFSRATFPELTRLTYVLSGVVEPNEIIKDKKISPFNIGEKIYLSDFTYDEFLVFKNKAELDFSLQESNRIYEWTAGNPRMVWDLCSAFEDAKVQGKSGAEAVDECVRLLYLDNFDHAPVDHIRQLVRESPDIRDSVWDIVNGSPEKVTASRRNKLYLSGIVKNLDSSSGLEIKNEIIKHALSSDWLHEVITDTQSLFTFASERFRRGDYTVALGLFQKYIESAQTDNAQGFTPVSWYYMGECATALKDYQNARQYYLNADFSEDDPLFVQNQSSLGTCAVAMRDYDYALEILGKIKLKKGDDASIRACINLGSAHLARGNPGDPEEAVRLFESARDAIPLDGRTSRQDELLTVCIYSIGLSLLEQDRPKEACTSFREALKSTKKESMVPICLHLIEVEEDRDIGASLAKQILQDFISGQIKIEPPNPDRPLAPKESHIVDLLGILVERNLSQETDELLTHLESLSGTISPIESLLRAGDKAWIKNRDKSVILLQKALEMAESNKELEFQVLRYLVLAQADIAYETQYITSIESRTAELDLLDLRILAQIAVDLIHKADFSTALTLTKIADRFRHKAEGSVIKNYIGFDLVKILSLEATGNPELAKAAAIKAKTFIEKLTDDNTGLENVFFSDKDIQYGKNYVSDFIRKPVRKISHSIINQKFGPNDRVSVKYHSGKVIHNVKYKKITGDLLLGKCEIIQ